MASSDGLSVIRFPAPGFEKSRFFVKGAGCSIRLPNFKKHRVAVGFPSVREQGFEKALSESGAAGRWCDDDVFQLPLGGEMPGDQEAEDSRGFVLSESGARRSRAQSRPPQAQVSPKCLRLVGKAADTAPQSSGQRLGIAAPGSPWMADHSKLRDECARSPFGLTLACFRGD